MLDLTGKTILVTGASNGIGAAITSSLGDAGAYVVAHYNSDTDGALRATQKIPDTRKLLLSANLADAANAERLWSSAVSWRGTIDVLVNNAGLLITSPIDSPDADWYEAWVTTYAVNVIAAMSLARRATQHFLSRKRGIMITMSSWAAQQGSGNPDLLAYAASKAALRAATQTLARAYSGSGMLTYVIAPGTVRTKMSEVASVAVGGEAGTRDKLAMGEWVPPSDIAALVAFLATGTCRHLSGATLDVNGASYVR